MRQLDMVGDLPPAPEFKDIRNTRPSAAEEKAGLVWDLGRLCKTPPPGVVSGGIQLTRRWVAEQQKGLALCKNSRATVPQLTAAIAQMRAFL